MSPRPLENQKLGSVEIGVLAVSVAAVGSKVRIHFDVLTTAFAANGRWLKMLFLVKVGHLVL